MQVTFKYSSGIFIRGKWKGQKQFSALFRVSWWSGFGFPYEWAMGSSVTKTSIGFTEPQHSVTQNALLFIVEALWLVNFNFSKRDLFVPIFVLNSNQNPNLECTLSNSVIYSILYTKHLLASHLETMLLDHQLIKTWLKC